MVEQALIVSDHQEGALGLAQRIDALGHHFSASMSRPESVSSRMQKLRLEKRHLQDLHALLLAAREADIEAALQHIFGIFELVGRGAHALDEIRRRQLVLAARLALRVQRRLQEGHGGDAGNFQRILEGEEETARGALIRLELEDALAVEQDTRRR